MTTSGANEKELEPEEFEPELHFVLDGIMYSLEHSGISREVLKEEVKLWFPDAEIIDNLPDAET